VTFGVDMFLYSCQIFDSIQVVAGRFIEKITKVLVEK
jgi:hypothetical protein